MSVPPPNAVDLLRKDSIGTSPRRTAGVVVNIGPVKPTWRCASRQAYGEPWGDENLRRRLAICQGPIDVRRDVLSDLVPNLVQCGISPSDIGNQPQRNARSRSPDQVHKAGPFAA